MKIYQISKRRKVTMFIDIMSTTFYEDYNQMCDIFFNKLNNMLYKSFRPSLAHRIKLILTNHIKNKRKD